MLSLSQKSIEGSTLEENSGGGRGPGLIKGKVDVEGRLEQVVR